MTPIKEAYLVAATSAATLLEDPAVAASWAAPSALEGFTVGGLAGHLSGQLGSVRLALGKPEPTGELAHSIGVATPPWPTAQ